MDIIFPLECRDTARKEHGRAEEFQSDVVFIVNRRACNQKSKDSNKGPRERGNSLDLVLCQRNDTGFRRR